MKIVAALLTFPNISWWMQAVKARHLVLDTGEHFRKMSYRNRYRVACANNSILLSIPLEHGREQRIPMNAVRIHNETPWQVQHWRTLVSAYRRSPYFDHYETTLKTLFETPFTLLADFNLSALKWTFQQLELDPEIEVNSDHLQSYTGDYTDTRYATADLSQLPRYYQVFEDRIGFLPNLSLLDLLFAEGPDAKNILMT